MFLALLVLDIKRPVIDGEGEMRIGVEIQRRYGDRGNTALLGYLDPGNVELVRGVDVVFIGDRVLDPPVARSGRKFRLDDLGAGIELKLTSSSTRTTPARPDVPAAGARARTEEFKNQRRRHDQCISLWS